MTNDEINSLTDEQINVMVEGANGAKANYCNNVNAMWPLIFSSSISILFDKDKGSHVACVASWEDCAYNMQLETHHSNPLRAAAIVYLKIKGVL